MSISLSFSRGLNKSVLKDSLLFHSFLSPLDLLQRRVSIAAMRLAVGKQLWEFTWDCFISRSFPQQSVLQFETHVGEVKENLSKNLHECFPGSDLGQTRQRSTTSSLRGSPASRCRPQHPPAGTPSPRSSPPSRRTRPPRREPLRLDKHRNLKRAEQIQQRRERMMDRLLEK